MADRPALFEQSKPGLDDYDVLRYTFDAERVLIIEGASERVAFPIKPRVSA